MEPLVPQYGHGTLSEVVPSLLAGMGVPGMDDVLGLAGPSRVCLLLVDGLGWQLLREYRSDAPFLGSLVRERTPITAGFPATTATSIASLATAMPSGQHGLVGYSFAVDGEGGEELLNALRWHRHGVAEQVDLRASLVPEHIQPQPTAFDRAAEAGVLVRLVAPAEQYGSGLSRAVLRGGEFRGVYGLGDLVSRTLEALGERDRVLCYSYHADLDSLGHVYGPGSDPWRRQLAFVDRVALTIAENLPRGGALVVTADHGMVGVGEADRVDFDTETDLQDGVRVLGGEARVRHVYTSPGATDEVRARWGEVLGDRVWIATREEAIAAGWFGPRVAAHIRSRIGDLVVAARGDLAVVRSVVESRLSGFAGQHGSLTAAEQLVPLLVFVNAG
ncbi:alkaline phosphatase family protein [Streptoalloteichus hindustanus]|uniref:Type I phosphodiesterase / nucleotide pyrophosphatase n=1 Tax=Streptoalloteichus hindustanus TaxID=2017 RepID=A0A1M5IHA0_STRHI|nr:nucleotide pyrophosphatase/phosphodiesterase family protein [Streptoalloteichus hindustanus]SHG27647.1 Type I phosphodiesterase / nucleotide pyrophosphatase [Streptoalloteichus hindustanus]